MKRGRGSALLEFAIVWPVAMLLVAGAVQLAVWSSEAGAARQAALAGARAGSAADGSPGLAQETALNVLRPALVGTFAGPWCPAGHRRPPPVWVCVAMTMDGCEVRVGGAVPALVPMLPGAAGLPVAADVALAREVFR